MKKFLSIIIFSVLPFAAFAQEVSEPETIDQALGYLPLLIEAFKLGKWPVFGALATLVLVFIFRQFILPKLKIFSTEILPIVSAVLGIFVGLAVALAGGAPIGGALMAVLSGPLASTLWMAVVKYFAPKAPSEVQSKANV